MLAKVLIAIMALMVCNVLWQVFSRYILGIPSSFTDELARYLMIWIGVLGAAYVAGRNMHVAINVVPTQLDDAMQKKLKLVVRALIVLFCFFGLVIGGARLVYVTYVLEQYSPALGLPLALVYMVVPVSGALIVFYKVSDMLTN